MAVLWQFSSRTRTTRHRNHEGKHVAFTPLLSLFQVLVSQRADKAGLGADNAFSAAPMDLKSKLRADNWSRARQRYGQLPDTVDDEDGDDDADD